MQMHLNSSFDPTSIEFELRGYDVAGKYPLITFTQKDSTHDTLLCYMALTCPFSIPDFKDLGMDDYQVF